MQKWRGRARREKGTRGLPPCGRDAGGAVEARAQEDGIIFLFLFLFCPRCETLHGGAAAGWRGAGVREGEREREREAWECDGVERG